MAVTARSFVIGDLQGCFSSLEQLLAAIDFQQGTDKIYLLGDIINRGPQSLECLRWAVNTPNVTSVLGNHDFHLMAVATGNQRYHRESDTLLAILHAPDKDALLNWLRHRPLLIHLAEFNTTLVHAGVPPQWSLTQAQHLATKVEKKLRGADWKAFVHHDLYGNSPTLYSEDATKTERLRYTINACARMRLCTSVGELEFKHKFDIAHAPAGYAPWFSYPRVDDSCGKILFGHWSTQGLVETAQSLCLDTGCLWGRSLSALCLETQTLTQIDCPQYAKPSIAE
jgi:bis(5'-nucleosyl)-tetraphosphatase (symmetrical)